MGMFDHVDYSIECPECGTLVDGFQSKSGECNLDLVSPSLLDNFYSSCNNCGVSIEFERDPKPIYDFIMYVGEHRERGEGKAVDIRSVKGADRSKKKHCPW